ncbi:uncharacterized protein [Ptychodera flava]|uniref:uncharacterized protein n=1 Tax=Ptychodera flava TaxID=63121 RepID=UPI00396A7D10
MTAEGREIVVVSIKDGSKTILDWFGFECGTEQNFCQLFEALFIASQNDTDNNRFKYAIDHDIGSAPGKADPVPTEDGDHFKSFEELYGTETTEKFRPSLVSKQTALAQRDFGFRLSGETVRQTILCTECSKPRCVCLRM